MATSMLPENNIRDRCGGPRHDPGTTISVSLETAVIRYIGVWIESITRSGERHPHWNPQTMIVTNTETVAGYRIVKILGLVQGNTVRSKHAGRDIAAGLKNLVGGELKGYTDLLTESRREAVERMMAQAQQLGANAVVNIRFTTSAVTSGAAELYTYGTAVVVEADPSA